MRVEACPASVRVTRHTEDEGTCHGLRYEYNAGPQLCPNSNACNSPDNLTSAIDDQLCRLTLMPSQQSGHQPG